MLLMFLFTTEYICIGCDNSHCDISPLHEHFAYNLRANAEDLLMRDELCEE